MAFIHRTVSAGSPEKSAGRAALSSEALVDMDTTGVTGGAGGTKGCLGGAGGTALCLEVLGVCGVEVRGTMVKGAVAKDSGKDDYSSSSLDLVSRSL